MTAGEQRRPLRQIARELGIAASRLRARRDAGDRGNVGSPHAYSSAAAIPSAGADLAAEIARPRRENERLRMEREILKKTPRIFPAAPGSNSASSQIGARHSRFASWAMSWAPRRRGIMPDVVGPKARAKLHIAAGMARLGPTRPCAPGDRSRAVAASIASSRTIQFTIRTICRAPRLPLRHSLMSASLPQEFFPSRRLTSLW
jgi:transposase